MFASTKMMLVKTGLDVMDLNSFDATKASAYSNVG